MSNPLYAYSLDEETYHGLYATREEAQGEANAARLSDGDEPGDKATIWTGEVRTAVDVLRDHRWLVTHFIERLDEILADEIPSDEPILTIKPGHAADMQKALLDAVAEHCESHRYGVKNAQAHQIVIGE